jgi:hypothetical protein
MDSAADAVDVADVVADVVAVKKVARVMAATNKVRMTQAMTIALPVAMKNLRQHVRGRQKCAPTHRERNPNAPSHNAASICPLRPAKAIRFAIMLSARPHPQHLAHPKRRLHRRLPVAQPSVR